MKYHVRRKDKEITDLVVLRKIIREPEYVTLAMTKGNQPYLVSISHGYDEERNCIYFHSAKEGKKLDYLRANNAVWGQALIDHGFKGDACTHIYASVHFYGRVTFIEDREEKMHALRMMAEKLADDPDARMLNAHAKLGEIIMGRIDIEHMTGKKSEEVEL